MKFELPTYPKVWRHIWMLPLLTCCCFFVKTVWFHKILLKNHEIRNSLSDLVNRSKKTAGHFFRCYSLRNKKPNKSQVTQFEIGQSDSYFTYLSRGVRQHCYKKKAASVGQNGSHSALCNPSPIYSWFLKSLYVLHSRFLTKKSWVVAYF